MYQLVAAGVITHLATSKAAEGGGHWVIDEKKDPGITNDYRTVGGALLLGAAALTRNPQMAMMAGAGAVGLGFSYLTDDARRRAIEGGKAKQLGAPMNPAPAKSGGVGQTLPMQQVGWDAAGQPVFGYVGQLPQGNYGCAPTQSYQQAPGPWATQQGTPPWHQSVMSGQAPLAAPFG